MKEQIKENLENVKAELLKLRSGISDSEDILRHRSNVEILVRLEGMCNQANEILDYIIEDSLD